MILNSNLAVRWFDVKSGLLMAVGCIIIFSIVLQDPVWDAMGKNSNAALALVFWGALCPQCTGFAVASALPITMSLVIATACYCIIGFSAYAATGGSYAPGAAKAWTFSALSTVIIALIHLVRVRFPMYDITGMAAQLQIACFLYPLYPFSGTVINGDFVWGLVVAFMLPVVVGAFVAAFVVPSPGSQQARFLLRSLFSLTASIQSQATELICGDIDANHGRLAAAGDAKEGEFIGVAAGLQDKLVKVCMLDNAAIKCEF